MRSQVREESSEGGSVGGRDTDLGRVVSGKEDLNSITRLEQGGVENREKGKLG
jgi:hypothetical protein